MKSSPAPKAARLWQAHSPSKDFRDAKWQSQPLAAKDELLVGRVAKPANGHVALFGELRFELDGLGFSLCTLVRRE